MQLLTASVLGMTKHPRNRRPERKKRTSHRRGATILLRKKRRSTSIPDGFRRSANSRNSERKLHASNHWEEISQQKLRAGGRNNTEILPNRTPGIKRSSKKMANSTG